MQAITVTAPAKLNLTLHITGKRPDGYHLLESLVMFTELGDILECSPSDDLTLTVQGPFAHAIDSEENDNLVLRAARLLQTHAGISSGAHIVLDKQIPVGAGLGGGSSDAASTLKALTRLWKISCSEKELQTLGQQLGSDVPACVAARPAWVSGIGETVVPVTVATEAWVVMANPNKKLLTADVYRHFSGAFSESATMPGTLATLSALLSAIASKQNDLEAPATALLPDIRQVLAALLATSGCRLARMSGSGATCFGLYEDAGTARSAAASITQLHPGWWCVPTALRHSV